MLFRKEGAHAKRAPGLSRDKALVLTAVFTWGAYMTSMVIGTLVFVWMPDNEGLPQDSESVRRNVVVRQEPSTSR